MDNRKVKNTTVELNDDALENVSGGTCGELETCPVRGTQIKEGAVELTGATLDEMRVESKAKPRSPIEIGNGAIPLIES